MENASQENLEALSSEDLEAVSGGIWVYTSSTTTSGCTSDGSRCSTRTTVTRYWIN